MDENDIEIYWAIYIDIEGFCQLHVKDLAFDAMINLTEILYNNAFKQYEFLNIIQFGSDGFLIIQKGAYMGVLNIPINIATICLQQLLIKNTLGRAHISFGSMKDISKLYPEVITKSLVNNIIKIGSLGFMFLNPFIGDAIINTFKLQGPKGPLLLLDKRFDKRIDKNSIFHENIPKNYIREHENEFSHSINWTKLITVEIFKSQKENSYSYENLKLLLKQYLSQHNIPPEWKRNAELLIK